MFDCLPVFLLKWDFPRTQVFNVIHASLCSHLALSCLQTKHALTHLRICTYKNREMYTFLNEIIDFWMYNLPVLIQIAITLM